MRRDELIRKLKALGKVRSEIVQWDEKRGKGSHGTIYFGGRKATVPGGELKRKTMYSILAQLGIDPKEIGQ